MPQFLNNVPMSRGLNARENVDEKSESFGTLIDLFKVTAKLKYGLETGGTWSLRIYPGGILLTPKLTLAPAPPLGSQGWGPEGRIGGPWDSVSSLSCPSRTEEMQDLMLKPGPLVTKTGEGHSLGQSQDPAALLGILIKGLGRRGPGLSAGALRPGPSPCLRSRRGTLGAPGGVEPAALGAGSTGAPTSHAEEGIISHRHGQAWVSSLRRATAPRSLYFLPSWGWDAAP